MGPRMRIKENRCGQPGRSGGTERQVSEAIAITRRTTGNRQGLGPFLWGGNKGGDELFSSKGP